MRLLLVEDDELLGDGLRIGLKQSGYTVEWLKDGIAADQALQQEQFDLVVLDLGLPRQSGLEVLKNLRKSGNSVPVLILTARDAVKDRVEGLDCGGDDYLVKPFDLDELCARLRALQRRRSGRVEPQIQHGDLLVDPAAHKVSLAGNEINLSTSEFALLHYLLDNRGRVIPRTRLEEMLYGWQSEVESNALEVFIHHLRKKLGRDLIRTVRGVGYVIEK
ncbi:MAG: response regulator [Thiohalomonadales bacterium]|nr:response regulator [Thiohalomonadales bacterium]